MTDRRSILRAALAVPAAPRLMEVDPLFEAVEGYRAGVARYNAELPHDATNEQCDALAEVTFRPVYDMDPLPPATTEHGVVAALQAVIDEDAFVDDICRRLILAALAYFEGRAS